MKPLFILSTVLLTATAHAQVRTSENFGYAIVAETLDFGGQTVASADSVYSIQGSIAPVIGISENTSPVTTTARHGYIGELYDILGFGILFTENYPPEGSTTQVIPLRTLDDNTYLNVPLGDVLYSAPEGGPVASISSTGLITTSPIDQETSALIRAVFPAMEGAVAELQIFVQDTLPDNFGTYASDGLPDAWQRLHFGSDNPLAAPLLDPDGDGQNNRFEYTAGLVPTNPLSRFLLTIAKVPGQPAHRELKFSPTLPDRTYTVKSNTTLTGGVWENLSDQTDDNQQPDRTVTDRAASTPTKFYKVEITKP